MLAGSNDCTLVGSADGMLLGSVLGSTAEPDAGPEPSLVGALVAKPKVGSAVGAQVGSVVGSELGEPVSIPPSYPTGPPLQSATTSAIELLTSLLQHVPTATTTPEESNTVHSPSAQLDVDVALEHDPIPNVSPGIASHTVRTNHSLGMSLRLIFS